MDDTFVTVFFPHSVFSAPEMSCSNHSSCTSFGYFIKSSIWWIRFFMNQVKTELKMVIGRLYFRFAQKLSSLKQSWNRGKPYAPFHSLPALQARPIQVFFLQTAGKPCR